MERNREIPRRPEEMSKLLMRNLKKAEEVSRELDPLEAAYLAGRIDGLADAMWIKERSA